MEWARAGLRLNVGRTKVFAPDPGFSMGDWARSRVSVLKCLGADLTDDGVAWEHPTQGGTPNDGLARAAIKITTYAHRLRELEDSGLSIQLAQSLLRYATVGGPQHILMCKLLTPEQAAAYDAAVCGAWQLVLGLDMTDDNWERATYPLKRGGLATGTVETGLGGLPGRPLPHDAGGLQADGMRRDRGPSARCPCPGSGYHRRHGRPP